jgi:hypothetical protein
MHVQQHPTFGNCRSLYLLNMDDGVEHHNRQPGFGSLSAAKATGVFFVVNNIPNESSRT